MPSSISCSIFLSVASSAIAFVPFSFASAPMVGKGEAEGQGEDEVVFHACEAMTSVKSEQAETRSHSRAGDSWLSVNCYLLSGKEKEVSQLLTD